MIVAGEGDIRLDFLSDSAFLAGNVQIYSSGSWKNICVSEFIGATEAAVVCRQLGYSGGALYPIYVFDSDDGSAVWLGNFNCSGTEATLSDCYFYDQEKQGGCISTDLSFGYNYYLDNFGVECASPSPSPPANEEFPSPVGGFLIVTTDFRTILLTFTCTPSLKVGVGVISL